MKLIPQISAKCKNCAYKLGIIKTLVYPCPQCAGRTSIFSGFPTVPVGGKTMKWLGDKRDGSIKLKGHLKEEFK